MTDKSNCLKIVLKSLSQKRALTFVIDIWSVKVTDHGSCTTLIKDCDQFKVSSKAGDRKTCKKSINKYKKFVFQCNY